MARTAIRKQPQAEVLIRPTRPPKGPAEPKGPHGGSMKNPPEFCEHIQTDTNGIEWVEVVICAFTCKATDCPCYLKLMEHSLQRIKLQNTEPLKKECPHCSTGIATKTDIETVYICGTIGNRLTQIYTRICKPLKTTATRRTRRQQ